MSNDTKGVETKVEKTTNQQAPVDETNEGVETNDSTAPESQEAEESEIDYKAELERIKALVEVKDNRLNKAEHKIVELKKEMGQSEEDIIESDDDPYGVQDIVKREVERITSSLKQDMIGDVIDEELNRLSDSQDERELIKYHYNNTIKSSGVSRKAIQEDLRSAYLLANQSKFLKENEELKAALKSEATKSKGGTGSNQKPLKAEEKTEIKLSAADLAFCKKRGIDPKTIRNEIR